MKRSEVLKLIEGLFRLAMQEQSDEESHAENLLCNLEELGMSPPSMSLPTKAILNGQEINVGNITTVRIWEPEDEAK